MKYTPQQCRAAFYQAAANIEARPELYSFIEITVGGTECPACMWGHVGRVLGFGEAAGVSSVSRSLGIKDSAIYLPGTYGGVPGGFDHEPTNFEFAADPIAAAARLRAFADHHWPEDSTTQVRPDLRECGQSFAELMDSLKEQTA